MLKNLFQTLLAILLGTIAAEPYADTTLSSQYGFSVTMPDGWFVINPKIIASANANESPESLGIPGGVDKALTADIMEKVKGGKIEFYYDKKYFNKDFKNNISAQLIPPLSFQSMDEVNKACEDIPSELTSIFGEKPELHSCRLFASNNRAVFHHAYTLKSQNLTIINETIIVNAKYSLAVVGGSANDMDGLHRLRAAQQALVDAATKHLDVQKKKEMTTIIEQVNGIVGI